MWQAGSLGTMMEGAIMAFENDNGIYTLPYDGPTATVWKTLIANVLAGKHNTFGYSFADVQRRLTEPESVAQRQDDHRRDRRQHRHPLGADRHRHLSRL